MLFPSGGASFLGPDPPPTHRTLSLISRSGLVDIILRAPHNHSLTV